MLPIVDQDTLIHDLRQIYQMLSSGLTVLPELVMPVGARVRIKIAANRSTGFPQMYF